MEDTLPKRPLRPALKRGFMRKCPNCNRGALFRGYLAVNDSCPSCGEEFSHQRADDGPAWATMLITGHLIPPIILGIYNHYENPNPLVVGIVLIVLFTTITLMLLPRIKGAFVAIQWANYMYGFHPKASKVKPPQKATQR